MVAFEGHWNGRGLCTAGVGERGVLTAMASWGKRASRHRGTGDVIVGKFEEELSFEVGGLTQDRDGASVHVKWARRKLRPGDEIRIKVVRAARPDEPQSSRREDSELAEEQKRRYYEHLKR
jgi:hypothetical protein